MTPLVSSLRPGPSSATAPRPAETPGLQSETNIQGFLLSCSSNPSGEYRQDLTNDHIVATSSSSRWTTCRVPPSPGCAHTRASPARAPRAPRGVRSTPPPSPVDMSEYVCDCLSQML